MTFSCLSLVFFFISLVFGVQVPYSTSSIRVTGGVPDDSSFNVLLKSANSGKYCSASLFAPQWVLFAGHCANYLRAGDFAMVGNSKSQRFKLEEVYKHADAGLMKNDIAVARLDSAAGPDAKILPLSRAVPPSDATVTFYGYGSTQRGSKGHSTLRKTNMVLMGIHDCWETLVMAGAFKPARLLRTKMHMCANVRTGGAGICDGDSGGALVYKGKQVGIAIVRTEKVCGEAKWPDIFINVANYVDWIEKHVGQSVAMQEAKSSTKVSKPVVPATETRTRTPIVLVQKEDED